MLKSVLFLLFIIHFMNAEAQQRSCGSMDYLNSQIQNDPTIIQRMLNIETQTQGFHSTLNKGISVITIPVVVHVLYNTTTQNISQAQIQSQIDILNADYRKLNADTANVPNLFKSLVADTKVEFILAKRDPAGNATNGVVRKQTTTTSFTTNDNVKYTSKGGDDAWASNSYLNLWVCPLGGGLLGYAQFPGSGSALTDGVVINVTAFGNTGTAAAPYNKGRTATHEVGHWLNLYHIWGDDSGACTGTDNVGDTPNQGAENYGCPTFPHVSCSNTSDMFMNYMDYTDDACMFMFSSGQGVRMNALFASGGARASLLSSLGGIAPTGTVCAIPTGLASSTITTSTATLNWLAIIGASGYNIQYKTSTAAAFTSLSSTSNSISLSALSPNTSYTFQVQTVCNGGASSFSATGTFTTSALSTCAIPSAIAISSVTSSAATISWTAVSGASSYSVQYKTNAAAAFTTLSSTSNSISITGLSAITVYTYQVKTICTNTLSSAYSTAATFTTLASTSCAVPTGITASGITTTGATISWTAVAGAASYKLLYKTNVATTFTTVTSTTNTIGLTGLTAATAYTYQVQTVCSSSLLSSLSTAATFTTLASAPICSVPSGIVTSGITATGATVTWAAVTGAVSYKLQYKTSAASAFTVLTSTTNSITLTGLTAATAYTYQVQTVCSSSSATTPNLSALSTAATFTTLAVTPTCVVPGGVVASAISSTGANVTWATVSGAVSYKLQYKTSAAAAFTVLTSTTNSITLTGLTAATAYTYQVQTVCSSSSATTPNVSALSTAAIFTTLAATTTCTDTYEANETQTSAKSIGVNATIIAKIGSSSDKDWFSFTNTTAAKNIQVLLTNLPFDYDLYLYNSAGTLLSSSLNASTTSETVKYNNGAVGTYYVKVIGYNSVFSTTNCYRLTANISNVAFRLSAPETFKSESSYSIFPNPAQNEVNIDFILSSSKSVEIKMFDITGKLVLSNNFEGNEGLNKNVLDISQLNKGIYMIECNDGEQVKTSKILIEK